MQVLFLRPAIFRHQLASRHDVKLAIVKTADYNRREVMIVSFLVDNSHHAKPYLRGETLQVSVGKLDGIEKQRVNLRYYIGLNPLKHNELYLMRPILYE